MLEHIERKRLPYTPEQMFDLVAGVDQYSKFAPWCGASRITKRESDNVFYADLIVGYKMFREKFSSRVHLERPHHIHIEYLKGPLKHLKNHWRFIRNEDGSCTIDFSVEFEFSNSILQGIAQVFFEKVIHRMVSAFEKRAQDLYGDSGLNQNALSAQSGFQS